MAHTERVFDNVLQVYIVLINGHVLAWLLLLDERAIIRVVQVKNSNKSAANTTNHLNK